jgi:hypothetical protein
MTNFDQFLELSSPLIYESFIKNRKLIYLDTNYWIKIADAYKKQDTEGIAILQQLIQLVESGQYLVPLSDINYYEILKQQDKDSLNEISNIMKLLSKDVCIIPKQYREKLEVSAVIRDKNPTLNVTHNAWMPFNVKKLLEMRQDKEPLVFKDNVELLNELKEKYQDQNSKYEDLLKSELAGLFDFFETLCTECTSKMYIEETGNQIPEDYKVSDDDRNCLFSILVSPKTRILFPSFYVTAELYSLARWNKQRKYKDGNDTFDYLHASVALPYFDYFFTEAELAAVLNQKKLDMTYNCIVESKSTKVLRILEAL